MNENGVISENDGRRDTEWRHVFRVYHRLLTNRFALHCKKMYSLSLQTRGGAVWQLVGLITRRSQVQILSPQPILISLYIPARHTSLPIRAPEKQHQRVLAVSLSRTASADACR
jgi:hypothetical protein